VAERESREVIAAAQALRLRGRQRRGHHR
jgi:hypothetical protein